MPSAFICCSSRRISGFSTAVPNHHQRTMGLEASGGFWKFFLRSGMDVCAKTKDAEQARRAAAMAKRGESAWFLRGVLWCVRGFCMVLLLFALGVFGGGAVENGLREAGEGWGVRGGCEVEDDDFVFALAEPGAGDVKGL